MKVFILSFILAAFVAVGNAQCGTCATMKWATCEGKAPACKCALLIDEGVKQPIDCTKLVPKCFLMKAEMYRAKKGLSVRGSITGKPDENAFVDNDGIYNPECENDGKFKAKQCNGTEECWCVNSAGVRRSDKGDKNMNCSELVETYWIRLELRHKNTNGTVNPDGLKNSVGDLLQNRYFFDRKLIDDVQYDPDGRFIVIDVKKPKEDRKINMGNMAYYMEKDLKVLPLFFDQTPARIKSGTQNLEMDKIVVYYVDEKAPTFTMQNLSGGIIAVIVVVVLAVVIGLVVLFFVNRSRMQRYSKTQQREMDNM